MDREFYFWAGIVALISLGIAEIASHRYADRKDELSAIEQEIVQRQHDKDVADLQHEAALANERAAQLEKESADAKLEIARLTTPRFKLLTPENVEKIVEKISPFKGTKFDVGHAPSGREQWDLLWVLEPVFAKAGWVFMDWDGPKFRAFGKLNWTMQEHLYGIANVSNVSIELSPENQEKLSPAANALADALNESGITARVEPHPISGVSNTVDAVHVLVGNKE